MNDKISLITIPNALTGGNLVCGILAIFSAFTVRFDLIPVFIMLAALFDFLDGMAARILKQSSPLGKQLDSLADMVSFGVAPGVLMMVVLSGLTIIGESWMYNIDFFRMAWESWLGIMFGEGVIERTLFDFVPFLGLLIPLFSLLRLAKFNIDERQTDSFIGLPTPGNALFFMIFPLALVFELDNTTTSFSFLFSWKVVVLLIFVFSKLLISELPLFSLKFKNLKFKGNEIRFFFLLCCAILIPLLKVWSVAIIVFLYLILSIIVYLKSKLNRE
jgi:CDP-diacylglycerol--serine O-phosphatidyltransferase